MIKTSRPDGTLVPEVPHFLRILPFLIPKRTDASVFLEQEFDITHTREFIRAYNREHSGTLSFFQLFLSAAVRTIALRPRLNRFVSGYRLYQRNEILFSFVVKKELTEAGQEFLVTVPFRPDDTLATASARVADHISRTRAGDAPHSDAANVLMTRLPSWMTRLAVRGMVGLDQQNLMPGSFLTSLPFYSTANITNLGSVGVDAPLHHMMNVGTCGLFVAIGIGRNVPVLDHDGTVVMRDRIRMTFTFDARIVDGIYCARAIKLLRDFVERPEQLETPPELTPQLLAELMLKP